MLAVLRSIGHGRRILEVLVGVDDALRGAVDFLGIANSRRISFFVVLPSWMRSTWRRSMVSPLMTFQAPRSPGSSRIMRTEAIRRHLRRAEAGPFRLKTSRLIFD